MTTSRDPWRSSGGPPGPHRASGLHQAGRGLPRSGRLRRATGHSINRAVADPNTIVIVNDFATLEGALAFTQDPSLPAAMQRRGVDGAPQVWIVDEAEARAY